MWRHPILQTLFNIVTGQKFEQSLACLLLFLGNFIRKLTAEPDDNTEHK